ncbi:hypothetical protein [Haladaptatus salinisoli]|uniref:hypothetical protein n=1 Tax=Haladaptatus salinisoli TaxID=2884876 RepID=UPI001D0BD5B9|nr:hypothetical protein [Haladaptatus salinisoli]
MNRSLRYSVAVVVGAVVTASVTFFEPQTTESAILLVGIAQVYVVGAAVALRYGSILRSTDGPKWASGAFAGVSTFACFGLLMGVGSKPNLAVVVLGYGLAAFGFAAGVAFEHERGDSP